MAGYRFNRSNRRYRRSRQLQFRPRAIRAVMPYNVKSRRFYRAPSLHIKRTYDVETINVTSGTAINRAYTTQLDQLPSFAEFTTLFNKYRINRVVYRAEPVFSNFQFVSGAATQSYVPKIVDAVDTGGAAALSTASDYYQYANRHEIDGAKVWYRSFVPSVLADIGGNQSAGPRFKQWNNFANPDVVHGSYMLGIFPEPTTNPNYAVRITCTVFLSLAGVR